MEGTETFLLENSQSKTLARNVKTNLESPIFMTLDHFTKPLEVHHVLCNSLHISIKTFDQQQTAPMKELNNENHLKIIKLQITKLIVMLICTDTCRNHHPLCF